MPELRQIKISRARSRTRDGHPGSRYNSKSKQPVRDEYGSRTDQAKTPARRRGERITVQDPFYHKEKRGKKTRMLDADAWLGLI